MLQRAGDYVLRLFLGDQPRATAFGMQVAVLAVGAAELRKQCVEIFARGRHVARYASRNGREVEQLYEPQGLLFGMPVGPPSSKVGHGPPIVRANTFHELRKYAKALLCLGELTER